MARRLSEIVHIPSADQTTKCKFRMVSTTLSARDPLLSCAELPQVNTQYEEFSPKFETRDARSLVDRRISPQPFDDMIAGQARHNLSRVHKHRTYGMHDEAGI